MHHGRLTGVTVTLLSAQGFNMTENSKPEWFEIAENDGAIAPLKASKTLPILAVMAASLILGIGAVVAQVQEKSSSSFNPAYVKNRGHY